jgi:transposase
MGKQDKERRVYTREFKAGVVALARKREKLVSWIASDLGINENMLRRWVQAVRETVGRGLRTFPGHGQPRDEELTRLRKEVKALRTMNSNSEFNRLGHCQQA